MKPYIWNGIEYPSIKEAAQTLHYTVEALQYRKRKGYTCDDDLKPFGGKGKPVIIDGVEYPSQRAAAQALGVSDPAIHYKVKGRKAQRK